MRSRRTRHPRRKGTPETAHQVRAAFEATVWRAARHGLVLDRQRGFLWAVYTLTSLDQDTVILYDLREVHEHLDRLDPPSPLPLARRR
jgi:hypothetical protein